MGQLPKISVLTPSLNCGRYIKRCIDSVLEQNYPDFEHIVMDGGSSDSTIDTLKEYPHIQWRSEPDSGEGNALNKALKIASGDIILWLNADDYLMPEAFKKVVSAFQSHADAGLVYGCANFIDAEGRLVLEKKPDPVLTLPLLVRYWRHMEHLHVPAVYYSRQLIDDLGPFNESLHFSIDYEYWLRGISKWKFVYVDALLAVATMVRNDAKSIGSGTQAEASHRRVSLPYQHNLTAMDRVCYWTEYYCFVWLQDKIPLIATLRMHLKIGSKIRGIAGCLTGKH